MKKLICKVFVNTSNKMNDVSAKAGKALKNNSGEGFVDTAVKVLMSVVIGALILAGLYMLFKDNILPTLTNRINEMFNFKG